MMAGVDFCDAPYQAAEGANAVVLVTEWDVLRTLDLKRLASTMAQPVLVNLRNVYSLCDVREAGFSWQGIGRAVRSDSASGSAKSEIRRN